MRKTACLLLLLTGIAAADDATDRLLRALNDPDRGVRYAAVQALGKARAGLQHVVFMLEDEEWCVRQAAGAAVEQFGDAAVPELARVLHDGSAAARVEAVEALSWIGEAGLPWVLDALDDPEPRVVLEALDGLWRRSDLEFRLPIDRMRELIDGDDDEIKLWACILVAKLAPESAHRAKRQLEDLYVRRADGRQKEWAEWALDNLFGPPAEPEAKPEPDPVPERPLIPLHQLLYRDLDEKSLIEIGRHGPHALRAAAYLRDALKSDDARVRGAATWALGKIGHEVPEMLRDDDPVVRELAVATISRETALRLLKTGSVRERRLAARVAVTEAALKDPDVVVRIEAARKLGKGLDDPERDVRIAAALVSGDPRALSDPNIHVRKAALRSINTRPDLVGPYLEHGDPYISQTAANALIRMKAAGPVAERMGSAHYGVLHYAPHIYEAIGEEARATVPTLIPLLTHRDVNVREVAARCLGFTRDADAALPLVQALADRRLPVVANAALALGRIGVTSALLQAMGSERPRVRAYAAFAIGQALSDDPIRYEPRLPVLDCGERSKVIVFPGIPKDRMERIRLCREGIKSADPRIAIPCAAALDFDEMGPWETERCIELLAPEGFRKGSPVDFEKYRSYLGPNTLPATLEYIFYPRTTKHDRDYLYGHLHRSPNSSNIPALMRFYGDADHLRGNGFGSLWQPFSRSSRFREERGIDEIWKTVGNDRALWPPERWWLEELEFGSERSRLLVDIARTKVKDHEWVAIRLLARLDDDYSERYLRSVDTGLARYFALAALAHRGHPDAMADLADLEAHEDEELRLLMDFCPQLAAAILRERLPDTAWAHGLYYAQYHSYYLGTHWPFETLLGIEPVLDLEHASAESIIATAISMPGCRTRRMAEAAFGKLEDVPESWIEEYPERDPETAFLWSADPDRTLELLRNWARSDVPKYRSFAARRLFCAADVESLPQILKWVERGGKEEIDSWLRTPLALRVPELRRALGLEFWPHLYVWGPENEPVEARPRIEAHPEETWDNYDYPREPWIRDEIDRRWRDRGIASTPYTLMQLALWPNEEARADLWSIYRAGRYRWVVYRGDEYDLTLGRDLSTIPHWIEALESNCCVISGRVDGAFEKWFDIQLLYDCNDSGVGQPPSERVHDWFELYGGDLVFCPMYDRFVAKPD